MYKNMPNTQISGLPEILSDISNNSPQRTEPSEKEVSDFSSDKLDLKVTTRTNNKIYFSLSDEIKELAAEILEKESLDKKVINEIFKRVKKILKQSYK
jgi:hypothetical protein